jgi:hypothetical protein
MTPAPTKSTTTRSAQPRWGWSGVSEQKQADHDAHLQQLVAMLPATKSGHAAVLARLVAMRPRFHGWLHQDEFGPSRGEQTAALRAQIKSVRALCQLLKNGTPRSRDRLDTALRNSSDGCGPPVGALGDAAVEVESALRIEGASGRDIGWFSRLAIRATQLSQQIAALDDNTDAQLVETALSRNIEILLATSAKDIGLVDAEGWLDRYRDVLDETLLTLNLQRGAQERVSLKLLVEELCNLWESETGLPAAAHGVVKDAYTSRVETDAGRFVTVAVEAMLPDKTWFDQHAKFARSVRAETFLPDEPGKDRWWESRSRQILVIMRGFVARRPKHRKIRKPTK